MGRSIKIKAGQVFNVRMQEKNHNVEILSNQEGTFWNVRIWNETNVSETLWPERFIINQKQEYDFWVKQSAEEWSEWENA